MAYLSPISDKEEEDTVPYREKMSRVTTISKICQFSMTLTGTSSVISGPMGVIISLKTQLFDQDLGIFVFLKR